MLTATNHLPRTDDDVPARLIETAIRLYGEHGCHAVSARKIIKEAGVLNDAAIRYYFGTKQDLLRACLKSIAAEIKPMFEQSFAELQERKLQPHTPPITARHVVTALFKGCAGLYQSHSEALKLLARMTREEGPAGQRMQFEEIGDVIWQFEDELAAVVSGKSAKAVRFQAILTVTVIINGLVDHQLISSLPADVAGREDHPLTFEELNEGFIDFLTVGVAGPSTL